MRWVVVDSIKLNWIICPRLQISASHSLEKKTSNSLKQNVCEERFLISVTKNSCTTEVTCERCQVESDILERSSRSLPFYNLWSVLWVNISSAQAWTEKFWLNTHIYRLKPALTDFGCSCNSSTECHVTPKNYFFGKKKKNCLAMNTVL